MCIFHMPDINLKGANIMGYRQYATRRTALAIAVAASLAACGGGGDTSSSTESPNNPPGAIVDPPGTITGTVAVDGLVQNAAVCLDLNANSTCDSSEPTSAATGADGAYRLTFDPAVVTSDQIAGASVISPQLPGITIDTADGQATADSAYVLRQVPGKRGQINPLTTLVAAGMAGGMSEAEARANVAVQLAIPEGKIDDYQDDPAFDRQQLVDNARLMAQVVASTLEAGTPLQVGDQNGAVSAAQADLRSLRFTDVDNFSHLTFEVLAKPAGTPGASIVDLRSGRSAGAAIGSSFLYNQAYLTPSGWRRCDEGALLVVTRGTPSRSVFCDARVQVGARGSQSVGGQTMSQVVTNLQTDPENTINNGVPTAGLIAALGSAVFPDGSTLRPGANLTLNRPIFINSLNTDGLSQALATNLEQLVAARPAGGVALPGFGGSLSLGLGSGNFKNLRVAFTGTTTATAGTVQFYECDLDVTQTMPSNCAATDTGTYDISTVNGVRVMRFAGNAPTVMNHARVYTEVKPSTQVNGVIGGDWVFIAREPKPDLESNINRDKTLNAVGWLAMKAQLGI
jgi:hypothetical protein